MAEPFGNVESKAVVECTKVDPGYFQTNTSIYSVFTYNKNGLILSFHMFYLYNNIDLTPMQCNLQPFFRVSKKGLASLARVIYEKK